MLPEGIRTQRKYSPKIFNLFVDRKYFRYEVLFDESQSAKILPMSKLYFHLQYLLKMAPEITIYCLHLSPLIE